MRDYAFRTGYDSSGRESVHHVVARGCAAMLAQPTPVAGEAAFGGCSD